MNVSPRPVRAVRGPYVTMQDPATIEFHQDGGIAWDCNGHITHAGPWTNVAPHLPAHIPVDHWPDHIITPGLIDCHVHLPQLDCRNLGGYQLLDWLERYIFPAEARFADPQVARDTSQRFFHALLSHGTTTAMVFTTIHEAATDIAFECAEACGIRAIIGKVMMDQYCPAPLLERTTASLAAAERLLAKWHRRTDRLSYALTPRFALTCSEPLLRAAGQLAADTGAFFQTHIAETVDEVARAQELFPNTRSYVDLFHQCGCLGPRHLFAHAIHLSPEEWQQLAASGSAVAHCPSSNIFLQSGRMPYECVTDHQVYCGLGSDVGAGPEFSLWDVIRCGRDIHSERIFSLREGFYRATGGGAAALGLEDRIGRITPGYCADLAVFPLGMPLTADAALLQLTTHWQQHPVAATYVQGERCYTAPEYR